MTITKVSEPDQLNVLLEEDVQKIRKQTIDEVLKILEDLKEGIFTIYDETMQSCTTGSIQQIYNRIKKLGEK